MSELLLGLDIGTSGVKAGIVDAEGHLIGLGRAPHENDSPQPGWVQCDPERWWQGVLASLRQACDEARVRPSDVAAIGISVLFPCIVPLDRTGRALYPAILYCDRRSLAQVAAIEQAVPRTEYQSLIGNVLVPGTCAATSLAWIRDEQPEAYRNAHVFGFANTAISARLTGEFATDPTMVALSGLVDIQNPWQWHGGLCGRLGLDGARLPRIAGSAEVVGTVTRAAAAETGLQAGTPVVCGCGDVPASAVGVGATAPPEGSNTFGRVPRTERQEGKYPPEGIGPFGREAAPHTVVYVAGSTDCIAVPLRAPTPDRRWVNSAYVPRGQWLPIGTTTSSGVSIEWFLREILGQRGGDGVRTMTHLAEKSPLGSGRLLYVPYLQGERTPIWDPRARGIFFGLSSTTTRGDLARAVLEGTAFGLRQVIESLEGVVGAPVTEIRAVGGGTRNALWNQIKADVLRKRLAVLEFQETSSLGAALLAGLGAGLFPSFEAVAEVARASNRVQAVEPDEARSARYDELYALFAQLYPATRSLAHALAKAAEA